MYFQYLIAFEGELNPELRLESLLIQPDESFENSGDRNMPAAIDRMLGIIAPRPAYTSSGMHRSASHLGVTSLHSLAMRPRHSLELQSGPYECSVGAGLHSNGIGIHPENLFDVRQFTVLETAEKCLLSGLSNEVDLSLNSILFLSALIHPSNATPLRLSHCNNILQLILASVGIYDEGPASLRLLAKTWTASSSLDFKQFWNNMSGEIYREFLREDSCLLKEHSISAMHDAAAEPSTPPVAEDLFAPSLPSFSSSNNGPPVKDEEACLSRVLTVATLLVNLVTPPSSSSTTVTLPPQPEEDDDDLEQSVVFGFASSSHRHWMSSIQLQHQQQPQQRRQPASRSLLPFHLPPLSACRDNARVLSASPTALRFAFLCAYAHHSGLRQLGLQLLGSLRYPLNPAPPLSAVSDLVYLPAAAAGCCTGLELISVRFLCRCLLQSSDRCDMLAGLSLLTNLLRVPDGANVEALFTGLPQSTWARLIQLLCLPDLALVCAALEALYCATGMGLLACTRFWRALAVSDDTVSARAPDTVFAARHASIHLRPLLALLSLEGQSMGTGSLHRVKVMQRHAPFPQTAPTFQMGTPVMSVALPPRSSPLPSRPIYGSPVPLQPGSSPSHIHPHTQPQPVTGTGPYTHVTPSAFQSHSSLPSFMHRTVPPPTAPAGPPPPNLLPYAERTSPLIAQTPSRPHHTSPSLPLPLPPPRAPCSSLVSLLSTSTGSSTAAVPPMVSSPPTTLVGLTKNSGGLHLSADNKLANAVNSGSPLPLRVPPLVANVKPEPSSLSELTDRLQMPPPSLPPPSALRRVSKASSSSPPQNREGTNATPPGRHNLRSHSPIKTDSSPPANGCAIPVKLEVRPLTLSVNNDSPSKSQFLPSILPTEPTTEHSSGRNSPPALSPISVLPSRETLNSCVKVSPVSKSNSSTSLLEEVLNAPSTKSQLSSLLGDDATTPVKSLADGRLVNGEKRQLSPEDQQKGLDCPFSGNGIKKELLNSPPLNRLLVSKGSDVKLSRKEDQIVYRSSMLNGAVYSAETDPMRPKRPKMSPNSTTLNELEDRKGNILVSNCLSNGVDHNGLLSSPERKELPVANSTLPVETSRCPITTSTPNRTRIGQRWLRYNRSGIFSFLRRRIFPLRNRIVVPSWQRHRRRKLENVTSGASSEGTNIGATAVKSSSRSQDSLNTAGSSTSVAVSDPLSSSSSPPPNRTQAPPPFLCEWDACMMEFTTPKQVVCHVYSTHLNFDVPATATKDLERRCCLWSDCPSTMVPRAPYALIGHVIDLHCSPSELQARRSCRPLGLSTPRPCPTGPPCRPTPPYGGGDPTGWSIIKEVETRRLQSELWFSQMTGPQAHRLMAAAAAGRGGTGPFFGSSSGPPPREGPVTKHLRVTAALVLRNLATYVPEARKWLASETSLLCEIAMGACPGSSSFRTNDAGRIIAQCLAICQENASDDYYWPFRCGSHSVDLDA
ncbi:unnamed protein product [Schistocephalus solidus]|uniref:C2H2-type domain-containing protein n=1 Tax=Schistocephalus solidus TaxID=70667 RepID=A0A183SZL4_SCHSO|nr:unnamed protein product [Schistocephalus solidus]